MLNQRFLQQILDASPSLMSVRTSNGEYGMVNRSFANFIGKSREQIINQKPFDVIPDNLNFSKRIKLEEKVLLSGLPETVGVEKLTDPRSGFTRWFVTTCRPVSAPREEDNFVLTVSADITETRRAEQELREKQKLFESFFESANELIVQLDSNGSIVRANKETARQLGCSVKKLAGESFFSYLTDKSRKVFNNSFQHFIDSSDNRQTLRLLTSQGETIVVDCSIARLFEDKDTASFYVLFMRDITELKARQEKLLLYQQTIEASTELFAALDDNLNLLLMNRTFQEYFALPDKSVEGKQISRLIEPELYGRIAGFIDQAVSGEVVREEIDLDHPEVGKRNLVASFYPLITAEDQITGIALSFHDITARQQAKKRLRSSEEKFRQMASTIREVFWMSSQNFDRIDYLNPAVEDLIGYKPQLLYEKPRLIFAKILPEDRSHVREFFSDFQDEEKQLEFRVRRVGGEIRWCRLRAHRLAGDKLVGTIVDITGFKRVQFELEDSLVEKETLMREIHHRVKNNLFIITSLLEMQTLKTENSQVREILQQSVDRIQVMAFVHEILYKDTKLGSIRIDHYLQKLTDELMIAHMSPTKQIEIKHQLAPITLDVDRVVTCGLIINELFTNSLQHSFEQADEGWIKVSFQEKGPNYLLELSDSGEGLPDNFELADVDTLGLKLVSSLAENQLKGTVEIQREPHTLFRVEFDKTFEKSQNHI